MTPTAFVWHQRFTVQTNLCEENEQETKHKHSWLKWLSLFMLWGSCRHFILLPVDPYHMPLCTTVFHETTCSLYKQYWAASHSWHWTPQKNTVWAIGTKFLSRPSNSKQKFLNKKWANGHAFTKIETPQTVKTTQSKAHACCHLGLTSGTSYGDSRWIDR